MNRKKLNVKLVKMSYEYKDKLIEMLDEWKTDIEVNNTNPSPWAIFKNDHHDFDKYLEELEVKEEKDGLVPDSTFFCLDLDRDRLVGAVNIRHYLNGNNCLTGGHIGDGIRPSERRKGYATAMIGLALEECKKLGLNKVLMVCDADNYGSEKSIINNGGVFESEVASETGAKEKRYWITLNEETVETERLILRRLMPNDYKAMAAWDMDERVYKYLMGSACKNPEETLSWLPKKDPNSRVNILMLVTAKNDGHAVGIYALNHDKLRDVWTLSYVNRYEDWGKGYTTEGIKALMDHAVRTYGAHSFEGECAKANAGSAAVMKKLGMKYDHDSFYSKSDGSETFESEVYILDK
ncbi:MAG: GNAT family N-acetyltransferase [Lachnospiraceae bacterium]|nr:GNAT family N-acetyltransferase [Lachnospiraceae bacterium]